MANVELKRLRAAAKDINAAIDLETEIPVDVDGNEIADALVAEGKCDEGGFYEDDELKKDTRKVLAELDIELKPLEKDSSTPQDSRGSGGDEELPEETTTAKKGKSDMKKKTPTNKPGAKKTTAKKAEKKSPGVIATIIATVQKAGKKGVTKEEVVAVLVKTFPEREEKSLANTVGVQLPVRINKERDFSVERNEKTGRYSVVK